jgi:putative tryptophan/tyrosine transport system substrate-binding protein
VQLLKEAIPKLEHLAIVFAPEIPTNPPLAVAAEEAAAILAIRVTKIELRQSADVDTAVRRAASSGAQAFIVFASGFTQTRRGKLVQESIAQRMPGIYYDGAFVESGGFMSYATSPDIYRRAATTVDKILRGANPGDLPIEQPTNFELMINLRTAAALGISIPQSLQVRADRVFK